MFMRMMKIDAAIILTQGMDRKCGNLNRCFYFLVLFAKDGKS